MIECTLGQIVAADETKALDRLGERPLPPKVAYTAAKLLALMRKELKIYREVHDKLVKEHGDETPPDSGNYTVPPARFGAFAAALTEILAAPVVIDWTPLTLDDLGAAPLRADDLVALDPFLGTAAPPRLTP